MNADLHTFLRSRRSVRRFKPEAVLAATIQRILETATFAPSAHNLQPWRFAVLTSLEAKSHLAEAISAKFREDMLADGMPEIDIQAHVERTARRAREAPVIIVLCHNSTRLDPQPDEIRRQVEAIMGVQSVAGAGLQLLLAARAEGLAGTWICWPLFAPQETLIALNLPVDWKPQGMVFLGYPDESPAAPERVRLEEIVKWI
jgi:F420 biosynthesis protein FbiB-like protein